MIYVVLFFGAFFDATLGFCFFVFGEAFFLMAGGMAFNDDDFLAVAVVLTGAFAADQTGYQIGFSLQPQFRSFALARTWRRRILRRSEKLLQLHGVKAVVMSRLLGPVAWFTPPLCGSIGLSRRRFAVGSFFGVLLGVGMFVTLGYVSAYAANVYGIDVETVFAQYKWPLLIAGQALFAGSVLIAHFVGKTLLGRI